MLAVSSAAPLRRVDDEEILNGAATTTVVEDFADVLESIDFDDLFDVLPDLEMDPDMLAEFCDESELTSSVTAVVSENENTKKEDGVGKAVCSDSGTNSGSSSKGEEIVSNKEGDKNKGRKSSSKNNNPEQRKKKVKKVDWTPELHRRFVQAVEQLGVDKAVPSRILEIMGIHCLARHNIATFKSHRKHLLAREVEAANWS